MSEDHREEASRVHDLFTKYRQDIWVFLYSLTKKQDVADDLTQEVFLRVVKYHEKIPDLNSSKLWVFSIAKNVSRDYFRKPYLRRVLPSPEIEDVCLYSTESEAMSRASIQEIWRLVTRLKRKYAEVILLHLKYDLSFQEVATVLHENPNTIRVRYQRALKVLRKTLRGAGYNV